MGKTTHALVEFKFLPSSQTEVIYDGIAPFNHNFERVDKVRSGLGITGEDLVFGTVSGLDPV
jgi:hypothetical protein